MNPFSNVAALCGKTPLFFISAIIAATINIYWHNAYIIAGFIIFLIFFKKPLNFIAGTIFIAVAFVANFFFIATDVTEYDNIYSVKTGSARLHIGKSVKIKEGNVIIGSFTKKRHDTFFKPVYKDNEILGVYDVPVISSLLKLRKELSQQLFYTSGGRVKMAQALILGDKSFLSEKTKDEYTISGLAHLLAMSGMHVGIIVAIFMTALFFIPIKLRIIVTIPALIALMAFGAFSITVVRASLFACVCLACVLVHIKVNGKPFILFMASIFLLFSPSSLLDISFLLSFGAIFGIVLLMDAGYGYIKSALIMGVAATLFTAPLSLYVFGTTNHLSILSTVIMSPIIYLHIMFAIIASIIPSIALAPLICIEIISDFLSSNIYKWTYFGFILKTIPLWVLIVCNIFIIVTLLSKYKWISALSLLIIFYPSPIPPDKIFPAFKGSTKGFMIFNDNRSEIFFQGSLRDFKYNFLPIAAQYGIHNFDYGSIRIFDGENLYIKISNTGKQFTDVCINEKDHSCNIVYHTRSNSIRKKDLSDNVLRVITKSKIQDSKIIPLAQKGTLIIDNDRMIFKNDY